MQAVAVEVIENFRLSDLSRENRVEILKIYREFLQAQSESANYELQKLTTSKWKISIPGFLYAYAADPSYNCLFGGWPSNLSSPLNGKRYCLDPRKVNENYKNYKSCAGESEMLCNPALFGADLCVDISGAKIASAYQQCEKKFKTDGRNLDQIIDQVSDSEFVEATQTINEVCNAGNGTQVGTGMCAAIKQKMEKYVPNLRPTHLPEAQRALAHGDEEEKNRAFEALLGDLEEDRVKFDKNCLSDPIRPDKENLCRALATRIKKSGDLLTKLEASLEEDLKNHCSTNSKHDRLAAESLEAAGRLDCSPQEKAEQSNKCSAEINCMILSSTIGGAATFLGLTPKNQSCISRDNNCFAQLATAMVKYLIGMVKDIWGMIKSSASWVWDKLTGVEDATSDKQNHINQMSDHEKEQASKSPLDWVKEKASGIWNLMTNFVKSDIFCQDADWANNLDPDKECKQPLKDFGCLGCGALAQGLCRAGGIILAEAGGFMTGAGAAVAVGSKAAGGLKALRASLKASGKYKKIVSSVDSLYDIQKIKKLSSLTKLSDAGIKTREILTKSFSLAKESFSKLKASKSFTKTHEVATKILASKPLVIAQKPMEMINKVGEQSFKLGYEAVEGASKGVQNLTQNIHRVERVETIKKAENIDESRAYFEGLEGHKKTAWTEFKNKSGFENMSADKQKELLDKMYAIHKNNNAGLNEVLMDKKRDLVDLQNELKKMGMSDELAREQVRNLASKEIRILGEVNLDGFKPKYTNDDYKLISSYKADPSKAEHLKNEYRDLLTMRDEALKKSLTDPSYRKIKTKIDEQIEYIKALYPKSADLEEIKNTYKVTNQAPATSPTGPSIVNLDADKKKINDIYSSSRTGKIEVQMGEINKKRLKDQAQDFEKLEQELIKHKQDLLEIKSRSGQALNDARTDEYVNLNNGIRNLEDGIEKMRARKAEYKRIVDNYMSVSDDVVSGNFSQAQLKQKLEYYKQNPKGRNILKKEIDEKINQLKRLQAKIYGGDLDKKDFVIEIESEINRLSQTLDSF
jgi:hypothetical protein